MSKKRAFIPLEIKISNRASKRFLTGPVRSRRLTSKGAGFTLIELLVVVSIIALLMSILMPALHRARNQAKSSVCMTHLRHWGIVYEMYTSDNNSYFNEGWYANVEQLRDGEPMYCGGHMWMFTLQPYYTDVKLRLCPMAKKTYSEGAPIRYMAWNDGDLLGDEFLEVARGSYGVNEWISNPPSAATDDGFHALANYWRSINVRGVGRIPLLVDSWMAGGFAHDTDPVPPRPIEDPEMVWEALTGPELWRFVNHRHGMSVNGLFMDFSVKKLGLKQLWRLKWHRFYDFTNTPDPYDLEQWPEWLRRGRNYDL